MPFIKGISGNPRGRPKGSVNLQLKMLRDAAAQVIPLIVERALAGDAEAQKLILERGLPRVKPVNAPYDRGVVSGHFLFFLSSIPKIPAATDPTGHF